MLIRPSEVQGKTLYNMGSAYAEMERYPDAIKCFEQSVPRGLSPEEIKRAKEQISINGPLVRSIKAALQTIFGRKDELPPFISLPRKDDFVSLLKFAGPIFFIILLKVMCYSQMTLRASDMGMLSLASHNVLLRIFFFYTTFGDALSQAAQTFLPEVMYGSPESKGATNISKAARRAEQRTRVKATLGRMLLLGGTLAVLNSGLSVLISGFPR